jgi:hypothetical protein
MNRMAKVLGQQGLRVVLLVAILVGSGVFLGLAAGYPLRQLRFEESDAQRLDQSRLAGTVDPADAVVAPSDLPMGWEPGDPALGALGLLGAQFCGEDVTLPTALSETATAVFVNPADDSFLVAQAVRLDRWQSARDYVDDVGDAIATCDQFFRVGLDGAQVQVDISEGEGDPPVTDYVSRSFVSNDGDSVQTWSMMAVGDVVVSLLYGGPTRSQQGLLSDLEERILIRVDPEDFAPGGAPTTTEAVDEEPADPTATTVLEGGAADESETPVDPGVETTLPAGAAVEPVDPPG